MDRLQKAVVDTVTQNQQTVQCEVLTDNGQTAEGSSGHSDTEPTDGTHNRAQEVFIVPLDSHRKVTAICGLIFWHCNVMLHFVVLYA